MEYYTIHKTLAGLVDAYACCGSTQALAIVGALADYCAAQLSKLTPAQIETLLRTDYAPNPANEFTPAERRRGMSPRRRQRP